MNVNQFFTIITFLFSYLVMHEEEKNGLPGEQLSLETPDMTQ